MFFFVGGSVHYRKSTSIDIALVCMEVAFLCVSEELLMVMWYKAADEKVNSWERGTWDTGVVRKSCWEMTLRVETQEYSSYTDTGECKGEDLELTWLKKQRASTVEPGKPVGKRRDHWRCDQVGPCSRPW